jgi:hypothetical protein
MAEKRISQMTRGLILEAMEETRKIAEDAEKKFIACVMAEGFTQAEGSKIFAFFKREKFVKFDRFNSNYNVKHGGLWEKESLVKSLKLANLTKKQFNEYCKA